jgi:hypothetical protein
MNYRKKIQARYEKPAVGEFITWIDGFSGIKMEGMIVDNTPKFDASDSMTYSVKMMDGSRREVETGLIQRSPERRNVAKLSFRDKVTTSSIVQDREGLHGMGIDYIPHGADSMDKIMDRIRSIIKNESHNDIHNPTIFGGRNDIDDAIAQAEALLRYMKKQLDNEIEGGEEFGNSVQKGRNFAEDREDKEGLT